MSTLFRKVILIRDRFCGYNEAIAGNVRARIRGTGGSTAPDLLEAVETPDYAFPWRAGRGEWKKAVLALWTAEARVNRNRLDFRTVAGSTFWGLEAGA